MNMNIQAYNSNVYKRLNTIIYCVKNVSCLYTVIPLIFYINYIIHFIG